MSIITVSDPEIFYDASTKTDEVVRHVLFSYDSEEERCTGDARPILEMYPVSYVKGTYSGATYGRQSADELKVRINLPQCFIDDIMHAMGRNSSLNDMIIKVYVDKRFTPWNTRPFNEKNELAAEDTIGSGIRINGNLKIYLQYTGCSRHNKLSCYAQSHGKNWELRGRLLSGSIELAF